MLYYHRKEQGNPISTPPVVSPRTSTKERRQHGETAKQILGGTHNEHERAEHHRQELMSVRAMIEELQAEAEALTDKIKAAMVERGEEAIQGDGWKATWKNVISSRFDSKAFKTAHADLYSQYSKPTTTTRFVLSA